MSNTPVQASGGAYRNWMHLLNDIGYKGFVVNLPFVLYCALLMLLSITVVHSNESNIRHLIDMNKQIKEKSWMYKDQKRQLMYMTKESELNLRTTAIGLNSTVEPPLTIKVQKVIEQ
jgi:hypothetical protein